MTFSLGASGAIDEVKNTLIIQAEQYTSELADHVSALVHKVLDTLDAPHGVSASASGSGSPSAYSVSVSARALTPSEAAPPAAPAADPLPSS